MISYLTMHVDTTIQSGAEARLLNQYGNAVSPVASRVYDAKFLIDSKCVRRASPLVTPVGHRPIVMRA